MNAPIAVTLVAPAAGQLTDNLVQKTALALKAAAGEAPALTWLAPGEACDLALALPAPEAKQRAAAALGDAPIDLFVQEQAGRRKKLLVADMESTIITVECLDELAEYVGIRDKIAAITHRAMNGELDFASALRERVGLLAGLPESTLQDVYDKKVRLMPGARELVATMKAHGARCMLVSGGFDFYTSRVRELLGFAEDRSNRLEIKAGKLTGNVIPPILGKEAKLASLEEACARLGITTAGAMTIGDGANDLPMLLAAGFGVAYHAKPSVREAAAFRIQYADLRASIYAQGYKREEIKA
jgi:phosphoserine phosphatase